MDCKARRRAIVPLILSLPLCDSWLVVKIEQAPARRFSGRQHILDAALRERADRAASRPAPNGTLR